MADETINDQLLETVCEDCGDEMADTPMNFLIEGYEQFAIILCDSCFEAHNENEEI